MSIVIEHDKRRYEILEKALDVFIDEGFEDATYQKIADRCGITRTTLYIYFKNKREIFNFSIKQLLGTLEDDITRIRVEKTLSHTDRLFRVLNIIIERLEENRRLLSVILDYLVHASKGDYDPDYRVRRRTVRLRHILTSMLIAGIKAGEFSPDLNVKDANELLYGFFEATVFRLVVLRRASVEELKRAARLAVQRLKA
jgi:AcrR family transcriptional regulator